MWAWAHGGVSLVHSSAGQYASLPHVSRTALRPGDLVFFYSPIHHVGLYIGGGRMIDAAHSGPGGEVAVRPVDRLTGPITPAPRGPSTRPRGPRE
jgi:cell wall-associated NlpC family hydrolase